MGGTWLKFESWEENSEITLKMHLHAIFTAFWKISEFWNPAVAWKVPSMDKIQGILCLQARQNGLGPPFFSFSPNSMWLDQFCEETVHASSADAYVVNTLCSRQNPQILHPLSSPLLPSSQ